MSSKQYIVEWNLSDTDICERKVFQARELAHLYMYSQWAYAAHAEEYKTLYGLKTLDTCHSKNVIEDETYCNMDYAMVMWNENDTEISIHMCILEVDSGSPVAVLDKRKAEADTIRGLVYELYIEDKKRSVPPRSREKMLFDWYLRNSSERTNFSYEQYVDCADESYEPLSYQMFLEKVYFKDEEYVELLLDKDVVLYAIYQTDLAFHNGASCVGRRSFE